MDLSINEDLHNLILKIGLTTDSLSVFESDIILWSTFIFNQTNLPTIVKSDDQPHGKQDFLGRSTLAANNLYLLHLLLKKLIERSTECKEALSQQCADDIIWRSIYLAAQYQNPKTDWSSVDTANKANEIIDLLLIPFKARFTGEELLQGHGKKANCKTKTRVSHDRCRFNTVHKNLIQRITELLVKNSWKKHPGIREVYLWLMYNIPDDQLTKNVSDLMPGAFLLIEDWEVRHKVAGMSCLLQFLRKVPASRLLADGRAALIFYCAQQNCKTRDPELLDIAYGLYVRAADVVANNREKGRKMQMTPHEEALLDLVLAMKSESSFQLRSIYVKHLSRAIDRAGKFAIRLTTDILPVLDDYITTCDGQCAHDRFYAIKAAQVYIQVTNMRPNQQGQLLVSIASLIYNIHGPKQDINSDRRVTLMKEVEHTLILLKSVNPDNFNKYTKGLMENDLPPEVREVFLKVFDLK